MNGLPEPSRLFAAMDATWPAARAERFGPFMIREGQGGGKRVSSAIALDRSNPDDIARAETRMRALGQAPIFQIRPGDDRLDEQLASLGYAIRDPVSLYAGRIADIAPARYNGSDIIRCWPVLALQKNLWRDGGVGSGRIAVMERAGGPKSTFLARIGQQPSGVAFVSAHDGIAMLHALDVAPTHRRKGIGHQIMAAAMDWAQDMGCADLALAVTNENFAANALYAKNRMSVVASYHYRCKQ